MKRLMTVIMFFCISISFSLFNATQSTAAVTTKPSINSFAAPKAGESLTITWSAVPGACKYYVGVADVTNSPNKYDSDHIKFISDPNVKETSYTISGSYLKEGNEYKLVVAATSDINAVVDNKSWSWSDVVFFTVAAPPPIDAPTINSFAAPKAGESLTVTWSAVSGAKKYYIGVADVTDSPNIYDNDHPKFISDPNVMNTSYTIPGSYLKEGRIYKMIVAATRNAEAVVDNKSWSWSKEVFFAIAQPSLSKPVIYDFTAPKVGDNFTVKWNAVPGACKYYFEMSDVTDSPNKYDDNNPKVVSSPNVIGTSYGISIKLVEGHEYKIVVAATNNYNANETDSSWIRSEAIFFTAVAPPPLTAPEFIDFVIPKEGENLTVSWNSVPNAIKYYIELTDITDENNNVKKIQEIVYDVTNYIIDSSILEAGCKYQLALAASRENFAYIYKGLVTGNWTWAEPLEFEIAPNQPASASISIIEPGEKNEFLINSAIDIRAEIEGFNYYKSILNVIRNSDKKLVYEIEKFNAPNIETSWNTEGEPAGQYTIQVIAYDKNNNELDKKEFDLVLKKPAEATIVLDPENKREYMINEEVAINAYIKGHDFKYSKVTLTYEADTKPIDEQTFYEYDFIYNWDTTGAKAGEYYLSVVTYDSFGNVLDAVKEIIILQQPIEAKIVSINPKEGKTNDNVNIEVEIEGTGFAYTKIVVFSLDSGKEYTFNNITGQNPSCVWDTTGLSAGSYTVFAFIFDAAGTRLDYGESEIILTESKEILWGDLNDDGKVNSTDKVLLNKYILGLISEFPSEKGSIAADLNGDGKINSSDSVLLRRYILQIIDKFPVEM